MGYIKLGMITSQLILYRLQISISTNENIYGLDIHVTYSQSLSFDNDRVSSVFSRLRAISFLQRPQ